MRIIDVPVGLQQIFFVLEVEGFRSGAARLKAINLSGDTGDFIELRLRDGHFVNGSTAKRTAVVQVCAVILLIGAVKEQLIGDDGAAELYTPSGLVIVLGFDAVAFELVTPERVAAVVEKHRAKELVATSLRDGVDVTSRKTAVNHVHGRQLNGDTGDSVVGKGHPLGGVAVAVEAKAIVQAHAVHCQAVIAGVGAVTLHGVDIAAGLIHIESGVLLDNIVDVPVD